MSSALHEAAASLKSAAPASDVCIRYTERLFTSRGGRGGRGGWHRVRRGTPLALRGKQLQQSCPGRGQLAALLLQHLFERALVRAHILLAAILTSTHVLLAVCMHRCWRIYCWRHGEITGSYDSAGQRQDDTGLTVPDFCTRARERDLH